MSSILSCYLSNHHDYQSTWDYLRALQPAWVRIHQPNARTIWKVQQAAPSARIMLRSWDIDDHNGERKRELYGDPIWAARRHLAMWQDKLTELRRELQRDSWHVDESKWYLGLVNEPDPAYVPQVVQYSAEAMRLAGSWRLGLICSSVGTFAKPSEGNTGWTQFRTLEQPINDGGHILVVHEYWDPRGPRFGEDAGNLAWRHQHIPLDVPILIGEAGVNGFIFNRYTNQDNGGWQNYMAASTYAAQVREYIEGCDQRVQGVCLYMTDYHNEQWRTFDTTAAMHELLKVKDARPQKPNPFAKKTETRLPTVSGGTQPPGYVTAPSGVNLRAAPNTSSPILNAIPYGVQVQLTGVAQDGWLKARYGNQEGFVAAQYISTQEPKSTQPPAPSAPTTEQTAWQRSIAFVRRWEGGWADHPHDPGGATMKGITLATYTRWRQQHGQPAPTKDDLRRISDAEVNQIYYAWYWKASGAHQIAWPLCLAHFDTAVNAGVGKAQELLKKSDGNFLRYMGHLGIWYTTIPNFDHFGRAWMRRRWEILLEATA
jgi:uncharacterized protein YgiM (DUF1202 family)